VPAAGEDDSAPTEPAQVPAHSRQTGDRPPEERQSRPVAKQHQHYGQDHRPPLKHPGQPHTGQRQATAAHRLPATGPLRSRESTAGNERRSRQVAITVVLLAVLGVGILLGRVTKGGAAPAPPVTSPKPSATHSATSPSPSPAIPLGGLDAAARTVATDLMAFNYGGPSQYKVDLSQYRARMTPYSTPFFLASLPKLLGRSLPVSQVYDSTGLVQSIVVATSQDQAYVVYAVVRQTITVSGAHRATRTFLIRLGLVHPQGVWQVDQATLWLMKPSARLLPRHVTAASTK
jgi:hypothetical protein